MESAVASSQTLEQGATVAENARSLGGRTFRWTFVEGPTAGTTFEHTFFADGSVTWRDIADSSAPAAPSQEKSMTRYVSWEVAPSTHLVSYLAESGYTLTVAMNLDSRQCYGIASNSKEWFPLTGTVEAVG
jgi:MoaF N-terminal domain